MADLTALDMASEEAHAIGNFAHYIHKACGEAKFETGKLDCTDMSATIRDIRSALDRLADNVFTVNREQRGSDEAIQKQQILYRKEQERVVEAARVAALEAEMRPEPFSLD